jgi:hypothetical protein
MELLKGFLRMYGQADKEDLPAYMPHPKLFHHYQLEIIQDLGSRCHLAEGGNIRAELSEAHSPMAASRGQPVA